MKFSFLHIADIHLGRPFSDISKHEDKINVCNQACKKSFNNIVKLAIEKKVDFVLIAGDSFDSDNSDLSAKLCFIKNLERLADNGIKSYVICGNHDPINMWNNDIFLQKMRKNELINITGLTTEDAEYSYEPLDGVKIHTLSFRTDEMDSPTLPIIDSSDTKKYNIGLFHCDLDKNDTKYAPISRDELRKLGYDYYALGHIHIPEIKENNIVYAGSPQARTRKETGAHGCYLVEVENNNTTINFIPTDCVRFEKIEIDCSDCEDKSEFYDKITNFINDENKEVELTLYEVNLYGITKCYDELKSTDNLLEEYSENYPLGSKCDIYAINNFTKPLVDETELSNDKGIVGILTNIDNEVINKICETVFQRHKDIYKTLKIDKDSKEFLTELLNNSKNLISENIKNEIKSVCSEIYE